MDKFQDAYRQAAEGLPHISMDAEKIREGLPRQAQRVRRRRIKRHHRQYVAHGCAGT